MQLLSEGRILLFTLGCFAFCSSVLSNFFSQLNTVVLFSFLALILGGEEKMLMRLYLFGVCCAQRRAES